MKQVYPLIFIGDRKDAFNVVNTGLNMERIRVVMDCTTELPTTKWTRPENNVEVVKVKFAANKPLAKASLKTALETLHSLRSGNKVILLCSSERKRASLFSIVYLTVCKGMKWREARQKVEAAVGRLGYDKKSYKAAWKFARNGG